jgi:hypothetical protein
MVGDPSAVPAPSAASAGCSCGAHLVGIPPGPAPARGNIGRPKSRSDRINAGRARSEVAPAGILRCTIGVGVAGSCEHDEPSTGGWNHI